MVGPAPQRSAVVLDVRLLGEVNVRVDGHRLDAFDAPRLRSLLAHLLLHRDTPQPRSQVAYLLWPDSGDGQARTNLRQLLHTLRGALPDADRWLAVDGQTIGWRRDSPHWFDVAAFEDAVARARAADDPVQERAALTEAAERYTGDLLPDCYEDWIQPHRQRLRQVHLDVLERLTQLLEDHRDHAAAIARARELLRHDPLHEGTYRRLMRLHALAGERARALQVFHACATTLRRELGVDPSPEIRRAHEALLRAPDTAPSNGHAEPTGAPFVGRTSEWGRCLRAVDDVQREQTQALLVRGEAGIGKTRLVEELVTRATRQGIRTATARAFPAEGRLPYGPLVEWLRSDALGANLDGLDDTWLAEIVRLLPELRTHRPDLPAPTASHAAEDRQRLFHAVGRAVRADDSPLLLVLDDLQWCDRETIELLHFLVRHQPRARLLLLLTARSEDLGPDHPAQHLLEGLQRLDALDSLEVGPLTPAEVRELASHLRRSEVSSDEAAALHRATGGNALFILELVREQLAGAPEAVRPSHGGPSRVQAVIERRLQQLPSRARELVALAGVIGREFTDDELRAATGWPEVELVEVLDELCRRRIVCEHGSSAYDFVHDRVREVAAGLAGPARSRVLHRHVAEALAEVHRDDLDAASARIAHHLEAAGDVAAAVQHLRRAAAHGQRLSAIEETTRLLRHGLDLLTDLPAGLRRDEQELELQTALGVPLVALEGYGGTPVLETYQRAQQLCRRLDRPVDPPVLRGLALAATARVQLDDAERFARELLAGEAANADDLPQVEGHYLLGVAGFWRGQFGSARRHLEQALDQYDPSVVRAHLDRYAQDPRVVCLVRLSLTFWFLGEPGKARSLRDEALRLAEQIDHPTTTAYALNYACWTAIELGDEEDVRRHARAITTVAEEHDLGFFLSMGPALVGWAQAVDDDPHAGAVTIREGLDQLAAHGQQLHTTYVLTLLARAHLLAEDPGAATAAIDEALALTDRTGQRYLAAELQRLRGECLEGRGEDEQAEAVLDDALAIARRQGAPALALRAATSRAHLHVRHRCPARQEALQTLATVRDGFGDAATADVRTADALLREGQPA